MISSKSLGDLLPSVKSMAIHFIAVAEMELSQKWFRSVKIAVTYTYRDYEYQDALYAQGRTAPGPKVTNSRGGESWHNFRCAFDVAIKIDGGITWEKEAYKALGEIGKRCGLTWGGDWNGNNVEDAPDWDLCHFQFTGGRSLAEMRQDWEASNGKS